MHLRAGPRAELAGAFHALDVLRRRLAAGRWPEGCARGACVRRPARDHRAGQAPDVVEDGVTGLLVEVEDAEGSPTGSSASTTTASRDEPSRWPGAPRPSATTTSCSTCSAGLLRASPSMVDGRRAARYGRAARRQARLLAGGRPRAVRRASSTAGTIPAPGEPVAGGTAKLQKLAERWPNDPTGYSVLYLGTTYLPRDPRPLLWVTRRRGARIVVNQDGVAYPGWAGEKTDEPNAPLRRAVLAADHVVYQSAFGKRSSDAFLGEPAGSWRSSRTPSTWSASRPGP